MRITDRAIFDNATISTAAAREKNEAATQQASTGVRVQHPWDDDNAGQVAREKMLSAQHASIAKNTGRALDEATAIDGALSSVVDTLSSAQELAVQLSSSTFNASDRQNAVTQVQEMLSSAVGALNTQVGGRFVMGGTVDNAAPFNPDGSYNGDSGVRQVETAPGVFSAVNVKSDVVIKGAGNGIDVLQSLQDFSTALGQNDVAGIRQSIDKLQSGIAQVAAGRAQAGGIELGLSVAQNASSGLSDAAESRRSHLADADFAKTATDLAMSERTLDAALTASAKSFRLSIIDKL